MRSSGVCPRPCRTSFEDSTYGQAEETQAAVRTRDGRDARTSWASWGFSVLARPETTVDPSRLATVERGDLARSVVATGRIEPITKVEIKSKANGIIKELKVQVGDRVVSGQVLAELDRDNLAARLRESKAALAAPMPT